MLATQKRCVSVTRIYVPTGQCSLAAIPAHESGRAVIFLLEGVKCEKLESTFFLWQGSCLF